MTLKGECVYEAIYLHISLSSVLIIPTELITEYIIDKHSRVAELLS